MRLPLAAACLALLSFFSSLQSSNLSQIKAEHAVIDFSKIEIAQTDTVALDGKWNLYWQEFISPDGQSKSPPVEAPVRGTWKGIPFKNETLPADGWASYQLLILLGNNRGDFALKIGNIGTAYKLFANGNLIASEGKPGVSAGESVPRTIPVLAKLPQPDAAGRVLLVVHVSNFDDRHGGIWQTMRLGHAADMQHSMNNEYALAAFLFGAIFLIGLHHLFMFLRRTSDVSNLAFALICVLLALRALVESNRYLMVLLPDFPWLWNSRLAYLTFYAALPLSVWFLRIVFTRQFHKWVFIVSLAVSGPACLAVLILPPRLYTETLTGFQIFALVMILYGIVSVVRAIFAGERGSKTLAVGLIGLFAGATIDILTVANVLNFPELAPFGLIGFILSQSVLLSMRQEDAYNRLEVLAKENKELIGSMELKIIERTATIAELSAEGDAVLNALNEGVFLINREKIVGNKFSQKIFEILELEPDELSGKPFSEIVLRITGENLSEDARLFLNVLFNPDMEDDMVEQLNPLRKIHIRGLRSGSDKTIDFTFTRQKRKQNIMAAFVSCKDITADEALKAELEERESRANRQLEIVRTLFSVNPEALQAFYGSIESEIEDIDTALSAESGLDLRARIEVVYRATHTIKGSAQLFKIGFIADQAHAFESRLQELMSNENLQNLDMIAVHMGYAELQKALEEFEEMIRKILQFQREASGMHMSAIDVLRDSLPKMVNEICEKLGKQAALRYENFSAEHIPRRYAPALRDALVQCVRNALAHSIETPDERSGNGKPEKAEILIGVGQTEGEITVTVRDDGKSFDVDAIRRRAAEKQLKSPGEIAVLPDQELINLIFLPGFSTAEPGGSYAGRGAGMDIVARKIRQLGGKIRIAWGRGQFTEFTFVLPRK